MEFSRPEYWSQYPFPSPGDLPNPGIKPRSPALQADSLPAEPQGRLKNTGVGRLSLPQVDHGAGHSSASSPLRVPGWSQGVAAFPSRGLTCREGLFPGSHRGQSLPRSCRTQPLPGCWLEAVFSSCNLVSWRPPHSLSVTWKWALCPLGSVPHYSGVKAPQLRRFLTTREVSRRHSSYKNTHLPPS